MPILISKTLTDHIQTNKNLIRKIRFPYLPIFIGGIALNDPNKTSDSNATNVCAIRNMLLAEAILNTYSFPIELLIMSYLFLK